MVMAITVMAITIFVFGLILMNNQLIYNTYTMLTSGEITIPNVVFTESCILCAKSTIS